jgi:uncharacterized membrane protein
MVRVQSESWIHQWSRPLMATIAAFGFADTAYITYEKLTSQAIGLCQAGCSVVLDSPYATVLGQPLALFGMIAYGVIGIVAIGPRLFPEEKGKAIEELVALPLVLATGAMTLFSGYLMYLLAAEIHAVCYFCIASAIFSGSLLGLAIAGRTWENFGQLAFGGLITAMVTLVGTLGIFQPAQAFDPIDPNATLIKDTQGNVFFAVNAPSGDAETQLAQHLKDTGATMYGAYWCPHCCEQKQLFGQTAMKNLNYVECAAGGVNAQPNVCGEVVAEVEKQTGEKFGFPTWNINGRFYSGRKTMLELTQLSGYKGPQTFQHELSICQMP